MAKWIATQALLISSLCSLAGINLALAGGPARAKQANATKPTPSREMILSQYSYGQLDAAGTYLRAVIESYDLGKKRKPVLTCDPKKAQAEILLAGVLHSLIDEKRPAEIKAYESWLSQANAPGNKWADCASTCSCASHLAVVQEAAAPKGKEDLHAKITERLTQENSKQSSSQIAKCGSQQKWYCGSPLQQYMRSELTGR